MAGWLSSDNSSNPSYPKDASRNPGKVNNRFDTIVTIIRPHTYWEESVSRGNRVACVEYEKRRSRSVMLRCGATLKKRPGRYRYCQYMYIQRPEFECVFLRTSTYERELGG
jgi:hypothetical protein